MRTILGLALFSLIISMLLTPLVKRFALKFNLIDKPSERKIHAIPTPRIGGIAIFLGFIASFLPAFYIHNEAFNRIFQEPKLIYVLVGALIIFFLGVIDDLRDLNVRVKFTVQIGVSLLLYFGEIKINMIALQGSYGLTLDWMSLPMTVFWMVLVMNAINLIDGLDGLAAGVGFFISGSLLILCVLNGNFLVAILLASLCGSVLGFLWYNFNPATIFMGDSGSYFIGYLIGALSILGSFKSQAAATIFIPIVAIGIPLMDTVIATIRRFMVGTGLFTADRDHFHHRLLRMGFSQRKAVLVLYGVTVFLGFLSLSLVYLDDSNVAILLILLFIGSMVGIRKLGYVNHINGMSIVRWSIGIFNEIGLNKKRRLLNYHQLSISKAKDIDDFWKKVVDAMDLLFVDYIKLQLWKGGLNPEQIFEKQWHHREKTKDVSVLYQYNRLYMRFPFEKNGVYFGSMTLSKEAFDSRNTRYLTLSHIEHLRRTMSEKLDSFQKEGKFLN